MLLEQLEAAFVAGLHRLQLLGVSVDLRHIDEDSGPVILTVSPSAQLRDAVSVKQLPVVPPPEQVLQDVWPVHRVLDELTDSTLGQHEALHRRDLVRDADQVDALQLRNHHVQDLVLSLGRARVVVGEASLMKMHSVLDSSRQRPLVPGQRPRHRSNHLGRVLQGRDLRQGSRLLDGVEAGGAMGPVVLDDTVDE